MSDEELFEKWWKVHSPPGTFDKSQCKVAFIAGLITQRVEAAQHRVQADGAESAANGLVYKIEWVDADTIRLTPRR